MDLYNFIRQHPYTVPKRCRKADSLLLKNSFSGLRTFEHFYHLDWVVKKIPPNDFGILLALFTYGTDPTCSDVLDFCEENRLYETFDYLKKRVELITLEQFMAEDCPWPVGIGAPSDKRIKQFVGEADVEASVKIGSQQESAEYRDTSTSQTVGFSDNQDIMILDMSQPGEGTRDNEDYQSTNSLGMYLQRPRIINQSAWIPNSTFAITNNMIDLDVWRLYLSAAIELKMHNFRMFRATGLKLEFRVNGSPFHYGRLYAGYCAGPNTNLPFSGENIPENQVIVPTNMGSFNANVEPLKTTHSQWPGVFIDPSTNQPQEMIVPFMWAQNYASIVADEVIEQLGFVRIWQLNELRHSNGATDPITLTVTASVVDPILTMPTTALAYSGEANRAGSGAPRGRSNKRSQAPRNKGSNGNNTSQGSGNDEYGKGIVSAPASALASFAGTLEKVPIIGSYATATKIAASGVSSIAKLFGFSKPIDVCAEQRYVYRPVGSLATTSGTDQSDKLTLDPKQEITIDPETVGLKSVDEMSFAHLFKRESLIVQIPWAETNDQGTNLAHILVSPANHPQHVSTFEVSWHTALSWASMPFLYWRGTLRYRIQIVASQLHRGRLAIVYNPAGVNSNTLPDQAATYQQFIDITEQRDVTIDVRYAQPVPWLPRVSPSTAFVTSGASTFNASAKRVSNGTFSIFVLNELASPSNTAPITINVYVSAGDDFMVSAPGSSTWINETPYSVDLQTQYTAEADVADNTTSGEAMPVKSNSQDIVLNGTDNDTPDTSNENLVFFGEQNVSMRALLKRFCLYNAKYFTATSPTSFRTNHLSYNHSQFPQARGVPTTGNEWLGLVQGTDNMNAVLNTFLNFYSRGFLAHRGAVRWKYLLANKHSPHGISTVMAHRDTIATTETQRYALSSSINPFSGTAIQNDSLANVFSGFQSFAGATVHYNPINAGVDFEHPFYCLERFKWVHLPRHTSATPPTLDTYDSYQQSYISHDTHEVSFYWTTTNTSADNLIIDRYCAAGEDFSLHYFLSAPVLSFQVVSFPP